MSSSNTEFDSGSLDASSAVATSSGQSTKASLPSNIEFDSDSPRAESSSTSRQPTLQSSPSSVGYDSNNPSSETSSSRQPQIRPHLSNIEYDPNNPETPSVQKGIERNFTCYERVTIQLPVWRQHLCDFRKQICIATIIALIAVLCCILAYVTQMKDIFLGITTAIGAICFSFIWVAISEGPPFKGDKKGNPIKPPYLLAPKLSDSSYDLLSDSQRRELYRQQEYLAIM